ncbi:hypothetical protein GGX14DRAFT_397629 [Mycena pura]|uniref:Uncharacterized protein n=1 Tax=Mycena pura TaxID=153505 RepID=A0AAD6VC68_9AGAR|nr:hypothetical protein GGX14DRAFT_397629 [Mycena pura]
MEAGPSSMNNGVPIPDPTTASMFDILDVLTLGTRGRSLLLRKLAFRNVTWRGGGNGGIGRGGEGRVDYWAIGRKESGAETTRKLGFLPLERSMQELISEYHNQLSKSFSIAPAPNAHRAATQTPQRMRQMLQISVLRMKDDELALKTRTTPLQMVQLQSHPPSQWPLQLKSVIIKSARVDTVVDWAGLGLKYTTVSQVSQNYGIISYSSAFTYVLVLPPLYECIISEYEH